MLSVKQGGIKYHFLSLWYDSTLDRTSVSQTIGEYSTHLAKISAAQFQSVKELILFMLLFFFLILFIYLFILPSWLKKDFISLS